VLVGDLVLRYGLPIAEFLGRYDVSSGWKCWLPGPIDLMGVPANVVKMQVCIDDVIDSARFHSGCSKPAEKIGVQVVPSGDRDTCFSISDTRIDNDRLASYHDQERLYQTSETTHLIDEIGSQPWRTGDVSRIQDGN
jgi:hypothetical protein